MTWTRLSFLALAAIALGACNPAGKPEGTETCDDRLDNDGDLKTDCADPDCFSAAVCCFDLCTDGTSLCAAGGVRSCELDSLTGCRRFGAPMACQSALVCSGGVCVASCTDQCTS